jgi:hypothetical protein
MIGAEACQKGGSMRSKSIVARPGIEDKAPACPVGRRPLPMAGSLALVSNADTRPASAMKPGLY